jgi:ATP-dependent DNA helicase HFM1/MER3
LSAGFWENSNLQLRQVPQIGPVAVRKLVNNNVNCVEKLASLDTASIERYVSKNPPFGKKTQELLAGFPRLTVASQIIGRAVTKPGEKPKINVKAILGFTNSLVPRWANGQPSVTFMAETTDGTLVHFWRGNIQKLSNGQELKFNVELSSPGDEIKCWIACDDIVGTLRSSVLKHTIPASEFPAPKKTDKQNKEPTKRNFSDDEFGDELEDEDFLAATILVEKPASDYGSDEFPDVDDFDHTPQDSAATTTMITKSTAVQMANGKYACNHPCRDGNLLKTGQPCKHKCCHNGLDKPRPRRTVIEAPLVQ